MCVCVCVNCKGGKDFVKLIKLVPSAFIPYTLKHLRTLYNNAKGLLRRCFIKIIHLCEIVFIYFVSVNNPL